MHRRRLAYARQVFDTVDLFVSPSHSVADEFARLGLDSARLEVADYGFVPSGGAPRPYRSSATGLRIGFVGTLVWHKGVHLLLEAAHRLSGAFEVHLHGDTATFPDYTNPMYYRFRS